MQVVLRKDVEKVGKRGDIVDVADGFARNYLLPRGHAIVATEGVAAQAKAMRAKRDKADAKNREAAQLLASKLGSVTLTVTAKAGAEGKLFGSVTNTELADLLTKEAGVTIERRQIEGHDNIKTVGTHTIPVKLHTDVHVDINVEVVAESA
jgi:large subunit ribosomal protein L9